MASSYFSCDISQGFNFQKDVQPRVGHLTELKIGDTDYKKDLTVNVLGPVGDIVSEWILKGAFVKEATFGDYNWDTENEAKQIELTLGLDYAVLNF